MNYSILILFAAGLFGQLAHAFKKTDEKNKSQEAPYTLKNYWDKNKYGMLMVTICLFVCAFYHDEVKRLKEVEDFLGLAFFAFGYMGDSVFPSLLELVNKITDKIKGLVGAKKNDE
jgi:hypothetical protein